MNPNVLIALSLLVIGTSAFSIFLCNLFHPHEKSDTNKEKETKFPLKNMLQYIIWLTIAGFSCLCLIFMVWFYNLDGAPVNMGQMRAKPLIRALETYKNDVGDYPESLDLLIPGYLRKIPRSAWRYPFQYQTYPSSIFRESYMLEFKLGGSADDWYCYESETGRWEIHDSACQYGLP